MTKVKERKSESWKPGLFQDDGFISKNKKRKDKRMSLNLSAKKMETDEFIPIKKSMLALGKAKEGSSKFLSPALDKKQTPKKKDTPLPTLSGKKQNTDSAPNARKLSFFAKTGTPKIEFEPAVTPKKKVDVNNTPKSKSKAQSAGTPQVKLEQGIKSSLKKKAQKFIDNEAEEGEEPITDKDVKPYEKGQKRKSISFKFDDNKHPESDSDESEDDDDSDDSDELTDARDFFDHEASEGEETDDDSEDEEDDDEDDEDDDDDDEDDSKDDLYKSFVDGDDDLGTDEEEGSEGSEDDEDEEEEESDDEDDEDESDDDDDDEEELPPKVQEKKKPDNKTKVKPAPTPTAPLTQNKKDKTEKLPKAIETPAKKVEPQASAKQEKKPAADETSKPASDFVGYIKFLPDSITVNQIKTALSTEISPKNIVSIVLKKNNTKKSNKCLVYVSDEDSLETLENKTFTIGQTTFKLYKARESKKVEKTRPLLFLPRVPLSIDRTKLESLIAKDIGAENIVKVILKGPNHKFSCRNVLIELANEEVLKKVLFKGSYVSDGTEIIVRQAFESGFQVPIYKVVFSGVPEKVSEAVIKKAIEAKVGQGTVINVKFSFKNKSFAFISLHTEQAQKKLLQPGTDISIQGTKVKIIEFKPRLPKKRAPGKKKSKPQEGPAAKKQKTEDSSSPAPKSGKSKNKNKHSKPATQPGSSPSPVKKEPQTNAAQTASPKKQKPQQQQQQSPSSPSKNKKAKKAQNQNQVPDKKANLSNKLEAKKNKHKDKKMKKKQATSDE